MPQVAEVAWHISGDIGGIGVSRFRFVRQDSASITGPDVTAVATASAAFFTAVKSYLPIGCTWSISPQVNIYDSASGVVQGPLNIGSPPANVLGAGSGNYGGGTGARVNWHTSTLVGRRLLKGALFLVPLGTPGYAANGAINSTAVTTVNSAATTYLTAMTTAVLYPVIWHRPKKGATSGGMVGTVFSGVCSATPAGLRSRRS